jgi:hypothetical protein
MSCASFCCLAQRLWSSFSLFLLSLAHLWPSDLPSYLGALGDMFDSDSSKDLTSGVVDGIGSGHQIMKDSRPGTRLALL